MSKTYKICVTGGCGFIGSNFIRLIHEQRDWQIVNLDALTYAGNAANLADIENSERYTFVHGDICKREDVNKAFDGANAVIHFAAESHVDRSIIDSTPFVTTNVLGTQVLLDAARELNVSKFLHVSTDEVYGTLPIDNPEARFSETTPIAPNSPYASSKAASDLLVRAAFETFGLNVMITRCSNNFGPYQFPEKVIPLFISNLLENKQVPLYGDGLNVRDWIHVIDHAEAILAVLEKGKAGEVYNIGADNEQRNIDLTHALISAMGKDESSIEYVQDRAGHDRRYAIDSTKMKNEIGWQATRSAWPEALADTVKWYIENRAWWEAIKSGAYLDYYKQQYEDRSWFLICDL